MKNFLKQFLSKASKDELNSNFTPTAEDIGFNYETYASIRKENESKNGNALRFKFFIKNSVAEKGFKKIKFSVKSYGAAVDTENHLNGEEATLSNCRIIGYAYNPDCGIKSPKIFQQGREYHTFVVSLNNIGNNAHGSIDYATWGINFVARPFINFEDALGNIITVYGDRSAPTSLFDVINSIKSAIPNDGNKSDKKYIEELFENDKIKSAYEIWEQKNCERISL